MFGWLSRLLDTILALGAWFAGRQDARANHAMEELDAIRKVNAARADRAFMQRVHDAFRRQ